MLGQVQCSCALNLLMAAANHRSEVERATLEGRKVDFEVANSFFEKDPFKWQKAP